MHDFRACGRVLRAVVRPSSQPSLSLRHRRSFSPIESPPLAWNRSSSQSLQLQGTVQLWQLARRTQSLHVDRSFPLHLQRMVTGSCAVCVADASSWHGPCSLAFASASAGCAVGIERCAAGVEGPPCDGCTIERSAQCYVATWYALSHCHSLALVYDSGGAHHPRQPTTIG